MAERKPSEKRMLIDKANSRLVGITSASAAIVVFCLVSSYTLVGQLNYQNRVIGAKKDALDKLEKNIETTSDLVTKYQAFISTPANVIGGAPDGTSDQDGDNAKIILDALPSKYDFPALASSLEKLTKDQKVTIESLTGSDDEVAQANAGSATPQPIEMPFEISVKGNYKQIQKVAQVFELSIRPLHVLTMQITGNEKEMTLKISGKSYYQPERKLQIPTEVVK